MIPSETVSNICKQLIASVEFMHGLMLVHRDVKGDNFLMDRPDVGDPDLHICLSDFGTVLKLEKGHRLSQKCGTTLYRSPEFVRRDYGQKVDVWAIGVLAHGLVCARFPFKNEV